MDRRSADEGLAEALDLFDSNIQHIGRRHEACILADKTGKIIATNPQACQMFGHDKLVGKCIDELMPIRYREGHQAGLQRVMEGGKSNVVGSILPLHGLHKSGKEFKICLRVMYMRTGHFSGIVEKRHLLSPRAKDTLNKISYGIAIALCVFVIMNRLQINESNRQIVQNNRVINDVYRNAVIAAEAAKHIQAIKPEDLPKGVLRNLNDIVANVEAIKLSIRRNQGIATGTTH